MQSISSLFNRFLIRGDGGDEGGLGLSEDLLKSSVRFDHKGTLDHLLGFTNCFADLTLTFRCLDDPVMGTSAVL